MRKTLTHVMAVTLLPLAAGGLLVATPLAQADDHREPAIEIDSIHYNPPGPDTRSKLNREYITIENDSHRARNLKGWTIRDREGHVYRFGGKLVPPDSHVRVHTGSGTNTARDRYWRRSHYVWNNNGDRATLRRANGSLVDRCVYRGGGLVAGCDNDHDD
jgi:hypothetical protein